MRSNRQLRARLKYWSRLTVLSLAGALVALYLFSAISFSVNSLEFKLELVPFNRGETVIVLPPLGEVRASTHRAPFMIKLTLVNLKPDFLTDTLSGLAEANHAWQVKKQLGEKLVKCVLRWAVISGLGGAGGWFLCNRKASSRSLLAGGVLASVSGLLLFGFTVVLPYNLDAFKNPRYQGAIGAAPWVVDLVADSLNSLKTAGEQLEVLSVHMRSLCDQLEQTFPATGDVPLTVLAISDLHNNPAALNFIDKVIQTFQIDVIIDTGDITDYGTGLESELVKKVAGLPVPYLFVPGNHDNPQVVAAMREAGALVLDDQILEVAGLRVMGLADPASRSPFMEVAPEKELREAGKSGFEKLFEQSSPPDLVAAHNPLMVHDFTGRVPLIITGHTHRPSVSFDQGTWSVNPGSVGAAGIRGLQSPGEQMYSLAILYFEEAGSGNKGLTVVAVDLITVPQLQDSFTVQRFYSQ